MTAIGRKYGVTTGFALANVHRVTKERCPTCTSPARPIRWNINPRCEDEFHNITEEERDLWWAEHAINPR